MNKRLGFFDSNQKPQPIVFFGVVITESADFDFYKVYKPIDLFKHGTKHAEYAFISYKRKLYSKYQKTRQNTYIHKIATI